MPRLREQQTAKNRRVPWQRIVAFAVLVERFSRSVLVWLVAIGCGIAGYHALLRGNYFRVQHITIAGELAQLSEAELKGLTKIEEGSDLFDVSLHTVQANLRAHPWVRSVAVRRKLPGTIWIYVVEREPVALLSAGGLYLVDAEGNVFKPLSPEDPADLPIFSGITDVLVGSDGAGHSAQLETMLSMYRGFEVHPIAQQFGCSEMVRDRFGRIAIITERPAVMLRFDERTDIAQLDRLLTIVPTLTSTDRKLQTIDLSIEQKVTVKYAS